MLYMLHEFRSTSRLALLNRLYCSWVSPVNLSTIGNEHSLYFPPVQYKCDLRYSEYSVSPGELPRITFVSLTVLDSCTIHSNNNWSTSHSALQAFQLSMALFQTSFQVAQLQYRFWSRGHNNFVSQTINLKESPNKTLKEEIYHTLYTSLFIFAKNLIMVYFPNFFLCLTPETFIFLNLFPKDRFKLGVKRFTYRYINTAFPDIMKSNFREE